MAWPPTAFVQRHNVPRAGARATEKNSSVPPPARRRRAARAGAVPLVAHVTIYSAAARCVVRSASQDRFRSPDRAARAK